jgi:peptidoglycan hydrolase-like protein with peptidoglycan-binding domain
MKEQLPILIQFGQWTSEEDVEDLKLLLQNISSKYHFRWNIDTYFSKRDECQKSTKTTPEEKE